MINIYPRFSIEQTWECLARIARSPIMVRATSVYSAGVPYAVRFTTAAVKIPIPLAMFQF